jgi:hypothetical protein
MECKQCRKSVSTKPTLSGATRLPSGWKRTDSGEWCGACWSAAYILRAIVVPVASPVDCSWEDLRKTLKSMWAQSTACANRIITECYARDVRRNGQDKLPPMPRIYLYPELRKEFPLLPASSISTLENTCQRKYRAARYKVVWTAQAALPTHRYPTPFPIPAQAWSIVIENERPVVSLRIAEERRRLRLKTGPQFRRQYQQIRQVVQGEASRGEAAIYERGDALMFKIVAWLPRPALAISPEGTLTIRTGADALLTAVNPRGECLWVYNGDHLRRWSAEHARQLQRWSEDSRQGARPPAFVQRREAAIIKYRDRMNSAAHEIAAYVAQYALRKRFAKVRYEDAEKAFCKDLPWFRVKTLIAEKLSEHGIELEAI